MAIHCINPPSITPGFDRVAELPGEWFIAYCKPKHEKALARDAMIAGMGHYFPAVIRRRMEGRLEPRRVSTLIPFLPGKLFLCVEDSWDVAWHRIDDLPHSNGGAKPKHVRYRERFVSQLSNLERQIGHHADYGADDAIRERDFVRVLTRDFRDLVAWVESIEGQTATLEFFVLGRPHRIYRQIDELELAT